MKKQNIAQIQVNTYSKKQKKNFNFEFIDRPINQKKNVYQRKLKHKNNLELSD